MNCARCRHRYASEEGYAGITFSLGSSALEQLRNGRTVHLCGECAETLRTWLSLAPWDDPAKPTPIAAPFSKFYED